VFALVGLIVGNAMIEGVPPAGKHPILRLFFPLLTGIIILGWWGTAGTNTDVSAHVFGLASGIPIGVLGASVHRLSGRRIRFLLGLSSAMAFFASWIMVFRAMGLFA
jgi:membrane associated rhomboid family serine protease